MFGMHGETIASPMQFEARTCFLLPECVPYCCSQSWLNMLSAAALLMAENAGSGPWLQGDMHQALPDARGIDTLVRLGVLRYSPTLYRLVCKLVCMV